ncbi:zinc finger-containing ubiquitin peptidase 1 isoform X1 [Esox lucius]|uniref:Zinc finger-containing ubiquitin peptidase 1 n=1 Tax=Esox lucius TaxID=8010 RepID=A0A3P8ZIF9_ESOLU|nr:zinc finger-containing ubiquitin peptidase 1 isoform X1 [Esox lucius]
MLTCDICGEELALEEDMKTHLLLSHVENDMSCPLCSLSGVSYDELSFHVSTAHTDEQDHGRGRGSKGTGVDGGHNVVTVATGQRSRTVEDASLRTSTSTPVSQGTITLPSGAFERPVLAIVGATSSVATAKDSSRPAKTRSVEDSIGAAEQTKAKQKCLSSPHKEKQFPCPICTLVCTNAFILQDHVELHLQGVSTVEDGKSFECPLCAVVCGDSSSLQEHVELHLDYGTATSAVSPGSDVRLARLLQDEEDEKERRKEQEAKREAEEFKKLQRQFGVDSSGGYRRQMERTMEREVSQGLMVPADFHNRKAEIMESLASGVDDGRTRTQGVLGALYEYYQREARDCVHVWLSADTDHFCSSDGDKGWGCGYRNFQMLLSSLHRMEPYKNGISEGSVPSVPQVQALIEGAWREGLDPQGAIQFNQRLQGTRAWIGATEIYALCTFLGVRARILDFHQPTGPGDTHPCLFDWVKKYFSETATKGARLPPRVVQTKQPPLYLQHQGHSRSIVGVEQKKNGSLCLLLLDPGCSPGEVRKLLSQDRVIVTTAVRRMRKFPGNLKHRQYQLVALEGMLSPEEKQTRILNSRTLRAERIP